MHKMQIVRGLLCLAGFLLGASYTLRAADAAAAPASPAKEAVTYQADELAFPKGAAAPWMNPKQTRLFKVVEDENAEGKKALQVLADSRVLQENDIEALKLRVPDLPVGLYRVTARFKISGMLNCIGTAIRFTAKQSPGYGSGAKAARYYEPTIHGYHFKDEDAYQEFTFLAEVIQPDPITARPERPPLKHAGYTTLLSKADHEKWRAVWEKGGNIAKVEFAEKEEKRLKQKEELLKQQKWDKGPLDIELTILRTIQKGFGKVHNSLRSVTVDWLRVEPVAEPDNIVVRQVLPQKLTCKTGMEQTFHVWLHNRSGKDQSGKLRVRVLHGIDEEIQAGEKDVSLKNGEYAVVDLAWKAPDDKELWGCQAVAELIKDGKAVSSAADVFTVNNNPWAVMSMGGTNRSRNPYYSPPHYVNMIDMFGISYRDGLAPWPDDPSVPYISGMSEIGTQTSVDMQRRAVELNHEIGAASFMYIQPMCGTGQKAEEEYLKHPEYFPGPPVWNEQIQEVWDKCTKDMLDRWHAGKEPVSYAEKGMLHIEMPLNHSVDYVFNKMLDGAIKAVKYVGWDGIRWDGDFGCKSTNHMNIKTGTGTPEGDQELSAQRTRTFKEKMRAVVPHYTESANIGEPAAVYDRKQELPDPQKSKFHAAFLSDGSAVMDEGWMNAYIFIDPRSIIKDYFWGARRCVDWCRKLNGYWYGFSPARDGTPYFCQSIIYYHLLVPLAGGLNNTAGHICTPYSETGEAAFFMRFSQFFFDRELKPLEGAEDAIQIDTDRELWYADSAVWKDLPGGKRRYVVPLVNPPTIERFLTDRFSELPEPFREPFAMKVRTPEGFGAAKAWMLSAEPISEIRPLKAEPDGDQISIEVPELMLYRVILVEFEKGEEGR